MQEGTVELTQKDRYAAELEKIRPDVTREDRKAYMLHSGVSKTTLSFYLNGTVHNLDTANQILIFFKARIANREKALNQ